uniref:hypothetical protein n=1 Tax=Nocardia brasiliensis TaxID=37326 RepID=UPI002458EFCE
AIRCFGASREKVVRTRVSPRTSGTVPVSLRVRAPAVPRAAGVALVGVVGPPTPGSAEPGQKRRMA